jgi:hypothetical protein
MKSHKTKLEDNHQGTAQYRPFPMDSRVLHQKRLTQDVAKIITEIW